MTSDHQKKWAIGCALVLACSLGAAYRLGQAHADGIPSATPMYYAGTLVDGSGAAVSGAHNLQIAIWDDAASTDSSHLKCTTMAAGTTIAAGRFRVALDNTCTPVVHATADLWVDVQVDGASVGRSKLGAVPFAVEAGRAADLTPAAASALVPQGTVIAFAGNAIPTGWLACDGTAVSRSTYATLFATIGTLHGTGDGTTTFNLPDYRGRFLRGIDQGAGRDLDAAARVASSAGGSTGDAVGSVEGGATAVAKSGFTTSAAGGHSHTVGIVRDGAFTPGNLDFPGGAPYTYHLGSTGYGQGSTSAEPDHTHTVGGGDKETRPTNAGVKFIIKY